MILKSAKRKESRALLGANHLCAKEQNSILKETHTMNYKTLSYLLHASVVAAIIAAFAPLADAAPTPVAPTTATQVVMEKAPETPGPKLAKKQGPSKHLKAAKHHKHMKKAAKHHRKHCKKCARHHQKHHKKVVNNR